MTIKTSALFVTGTDTDAGKTYVSSIILNTLSKRGINCTGFKPISAGCQETEHGLRNEDALNLISASSLKFNYDIINPVAYLDPVAPHLAAMKSSQPIDLDKLNHAFSVLQSPDTEFLLVEGAGGWQLPLGRVKFQNTLSDKEFFMPDFVKMHKLPVLLVVGMKLGCLNHALLSLQAIKLSGCRCIGWIANQIDPNMDYYAENLQSLQALLDVPFAGEVKFGQDMQSAAIDVDALIETE